MKEIDPEDLGQYDGKEGRPTYIAQGGRVIDVSQSPLWKGGTHMGRHHAGHDLTADIEAAPHGLEVLDRYPQAGILAAGKGAQERRMPAFLLPLLQRFPLLRRHPHPSTVHFPIVFMIAVTAFSILYVATGYHGFETTAFHCLGAGLLMTPVAMLTGLFTWWLNYMARPMRYVTIKLSFSIALLAVELICFTWRAMKPDVLDNLAGPGLIYFLFVLAVTPIVSVIGFFGGLLTFPVEK